MIKRIVFTCLVCLLGIAKSHAQVDYYLPPSAKVVLDTNVWKYNKCNPSFLAIAGYFNKQRDSIVNKADGMIVYFEPVFFRMSTTQVDEKEYKKPPLMFDKLISADSYYARNQYYYICDSLAGVKITFNRSKEDLLRSEDVKKLIESLQYVEVKTIDKVAGYPLKANVNRDSLFAQRKEEFYTHFNGNRNETFAEHLFLMDVDIDFSFSKWKEYSIKDNTMNYTDCELAMCDSKLGLPINAAWLLSFSDPYSVNLRREDENYLRDKYRELYDRSFTIGKLAKSYNKIGVAYASYEEDPDEVEIRTFVKDKESNCYECSLKVKSNVYNRYYGNKENLIAERGTPNKRAWEYYPVDNRFNEFIVEVFNEELSDNGSCRSFSNRYLMSTSVPLEKPIEFGFPETDKGWDMIFDCDFTEYQKEYLIDEAARFQMGASSSIVLPKDCQMNFGSCVEREIKTTNIVSPNSRMYRAPLLYGDFNKNGNIEFVNVFVQSGGIVFLEIYEKDSLCIKPIPCTLEMKRALLELEVLQKLLVSSSTNRMNGFNGDDGLRYYDMSEGYDEVVEAPREVMMEDVYYGGYGDDMAIEPAEDYDYSRKYRATYIESSVEVKAEFPGGEKAMKKYIKKNLKYPFRKKLKEEVIVKVSLKITLEGKVEITYASASPTQYQEYFIQEAKRVCSEMPNWTPAELNGERVNMEKILYIKF